MSNPCKLLAAAVAGLLALPASALAQESGTVTGTVVEAETQRPLAGAQVAVVGTTLGTIANAEGRFVIPNVSAGEREVRVSLIGYRADAQPVTVTAGGSAVVEFVLSETAVALDEIVVTGTAGRQERRAQGAVVSSVNAADINRTAPVSSVTDVLQGRVAGVSITQSSGTSGAYQRVRLRGQASISLSNDPIVFIDGVRSDSRSTQLMTVGGQQQSRFNDINPEDIESIEIVKGPAAATLYGADASAGVIQIRTKRGQAGSGFTQNLSLEYESNSLSDWTPEANWGRCAESHVEDPDRALCHGQAVGTLVSDRPSDRYPVYRSGENRAVTWSGRGGGESFGYYVSIGSRDEKGVHQSNTYQQLSNAFNFNFTPNEQLILEAGWSLSRTRTRLPNNDNNVYGYLGGTMLGSPLSVGTAADGWYQPNRQTEALSNLENVGTAIRAIPRFSVSYNPMPWFSNRLQVGIDMTRTTARRFFPRNDLSWWGTDELNSGQIEQARENRDDITVDYIGNVTTQLSNDWSSDFSLGTQVTAVRTDEANATGIGLATNAGNSIDAAAITTGGGEFTESKQVGFFGQVQPAFRDRLFFQFAARVDRASAFGINADWFLSPSVGVSWVVSDGAFWENSMPRWINDFRLRSRFGTTGRSPIEGALRLFEASPYALETGETQAGLVPYDPGNLDLKPERGQEFEVGFDADLFDGRVGLEVTYFNKVSKDLILERPYPPSLGFDQDQLVNLGEMVNRGFEVGVNTSLVNRPSFGWDMRLGFNTLHNEVTELGDIEPFGDAIRVEPGYQVNSRFTHQVVGYELDGDNPHAIVTDSMEFAGNSIPTFEGNLSTALRLRDNIHVNALLTTMQDFVIFNNTAQFRDRQFANSERAVKRDELSEEERLRWFGPFVDTQGNAVEQGNAQDVYIEDGSFIRLREVALTYTLPQSISSRFAASNASITLAGRNLALWTDYTGADPEVIGSNAGGRTGQTSRTDFLTLPQARRWVAQMNLSF